ncbi:helix-turn-helix domain-containing protein [Grimontia hollisae]|uniref:helix-turn-helix domain-containing protein n=1 Tax=Grimontia hollisae TaxID=673 RepID=UPI00215D8360|nr:helix-turn-helix domain-containing protein [Grimontia hollisae]
MSRLFRYLLALNKYCFIAILTAFTWGNLASASPVFHAFPYTSPDAPAKITDIEYADGRGVWILDSRGDVSFYDGLHYHRLSAFTPIGADVSHIAVFEGALWLISKGQLLRYDIDSNSLTPQTITGQVSDIVSTSEGLWVATSTDLYLIQSGTTNPIYRGENRYQRLLPFDNTLLGTADSALYVVASGELFLSLSGEQALSLASDGVTVYLGHEKGLSLYRQGMLVERFLDGKQINHVIASDEGVWAGGESGLYLGGGKRDSFTFKEITGDNDDAFSFSGRMVTDIVPGQGDTLWVSSETRLHFRSSIARDIRRFPMFLLSSKPAQDQLTGLEEREEGYLLTTHYKLVSLDADMLPKRVVRSEMVINDMILFDDTLWLASGSGLKGMNPDTLKERPGTVPGSLNSLVVDRIFKDRHSLWLVSGERVIRFWPRSRTVVDFGRDWSGSEANRLTSIAEVAEEGTWLGTTNGLYIYFDGRFQRALAREEIGTIKSLQLEPSGKLWLLTDQGVYTYDRNRALMLYEVFANTPDDTVKCLSVNGDVAYFIATKGIYEYSLLTGSNRFVQGTSRVIQSTQHVCQKTTDNMLIAGDYGVFVIPNPALDALFKVPSVSLSPGAVYVNGIPWRLGPSQDNLLQLTTKSTVVIEVSRMPFGAISPLVYRLEGNSDPNWYSTNNQQLVFSALDAGEYTLTLKVGYEKNGLDEIRLLSFVVVSPWYQQVGYVFLVVIPLIMLMTLYYQRKNTSIKAQNKQLRETVHRKVIEIDMRQESTRRFCHGLPLLENKAFTEILVPEPCSEESMEHHRWRTAAMDEINAHFHDPDYSTSVLAKAMCVSERSLQRRFKLEFGITFKEALITTRLENAKRMLCQGDKITDVAVACGFNEPSYFTKSFRAKYGKTPSQFREECCEGETVGQGKKERGIA